MKKHSEESAILYLLRKGATERMDGNGMRVITISRSKQIGIRTWGVIDFLRKYCKRIVRVVD